MFKHAFLSISVLSALTIALPAEAKLYRWVDDKGVTHYGETVPPEFANKDKDVIKKSGMVEKKPEKAEQSTQKSKDESTEKLKAERQAAQEQLRRNNMLMNTYSNEAEIDQARDRSLVLVNARIDSNKMLVKSAQESLDDLNKEAESRTKAGKKIPASLTNDIKQTQARVTKYNEELAKGEAELQEVKNRFEDEKALYRKIKAGQAGK